MTEFEDQRRRAQEIFDEITPIPPGGGNIPPSIEKMVEYAKEYLEEIDQ